MALTLSYIELKRLKHAVERHVVALETSMDRTRKAMEGELPLPAGKKANRTRALEKISDGEEKRDNFINLLTKLQEEIRRMEGVEARTSSMRPLK